MARKGKVIPKAILDRPAKGHEVLGERDLRPIVREADWAEQRRMFAEMTNQRGDRAAGV